jgi:hypothetical protein
MSRSGLGLALAIAALAAPSVAAAAAPGPTVVDFEGASGTNPTIQGASFGAECNPATVQPSGGLGGGRYLTARCGPSASFDTAQATVSLFARVPAGATSGPLTATARDSQFQPVATESRPAPQPGDWVSIVLRDPTGTARITFVDVFVGGNGGPLDLDDVGFSPAVQPDVDITGGPSGTVGSGDASFSFAANQDRMTFTCSLDGGAAQACSSPQTYSGLVDGQHTFTVTGTDRWGSADPSPAGRTWTVRGDRDGDGVVDGSDNCADNANASQGDSDADGVGDACEVLPSGNTPLEAGRFAKVKLLSGEVFVKLPAGAAGSAFTSGLRVPFQSSGFVSLKGVAAVPMGSTLDTRAGEVAVTAAINGQRPRSPKQLRREARFRAGIFAIRQARKARKAKRSKRIPPRAELASPSGAELPCRASGPAKGTRVRSLTTTAKGVFRTVGGAATATPAKGTTTFSTIDRCDGTLTQVGRGRVAVVAKKTGKRTVVSAGRAYIVRARLFAARKGRTG